MFGPHPLNFRVVAADNRGVDQVSRPMQIALCAVLLLAGMWFAVLRPKADDGGSATPAAAPAAPGTAGLGNAVDKANSAVKASQQSAKATEAAVAKAGDDDAAASTAGGTAAKGSTASSKGAAAAKPATAAAPTDPSGALLDKLSHGKTVVLLFAGKGADDRAARKAVRRLAAQDKRVVTQVAPITKVGDYEAITTGVQVLTAPTVVVIGNDRKAQSVSGYTEPGVLKQLVGDARRAGKS
jgi:hypothetical protein